MRTTADALIVEPDEVPVISNELLEANLVSIRTDLTDLKTEFRAVVARIDQDVRAIAAEFRQDIRELRAENRKLSDKIDTKADELRAEMKEMRADIKETRADMRDMRTSIADLKGMQKAILWVLGGVGTLVAVIGGGLTIAKTLHWI